MTKRKLSDDVECGAWRARPEGGWQRECRMIGGPAWKLFAVKTRTGFSHNWEGFVLRDTREPYPQWVASAQVQKSLALRSPNEAKKWAEERLLRWAQGWRDR